MKIANKFALYFFLVIVSITVFDYLPLNTAYAGEAEQSGLTKESINPDSLYYPFKRILEKAEEVFAFSKDSKRVFYNNLLKIRLSELNYVVIEKRFSAVEKSSKRFSYQAGILTDELIKQNNEDEKQKQIKEFGQYNNLLATLRDNFQANSSFWMLIQHDINSLNQLSDRLK